MKRSLEEIQIEANKYETRGEFAKNNNALYRVAKKREDFEQICSHMKPSKTKAYTLKEIQIEANKYLRRSDFRKGNNRVYQAAVKREDFEQICSHMMTSITKAYTLEELNKEAKKFSKRGEFKKNSSSAYNASSKRDDFEQICSHMDAPKNDAYTLEEIQIEANKHARYGDFYKKSPSVYGAALKRHDFYQICKHMKRHADVSNQEQKLFDIVKSNYPKTQRLRDKKVKIEGKPYIKGFDLDIYVPEVRKGIEFDGTYWHSEAGLKRGRPNWPDVGITEYHDLKNSWFSSKGIDILHIKEEEWDKDKEACIKRCLEFLSKNPILP